MRAWAGPPSSCQSARDAPRKALTVGARHGELPETKIVSAPAFEVVNDPMRKINGNAPRFPALSCHLFPATSVIAVGQRVEQ